MSARASYDRGMTGLIRLNESIREILGPWMQPIT
ncbi:hypothetical protein HDA44_004555 [Kribbella solani]|uniref:Uncharacterized protein n=1 Tax=Kribbella solani TaxID=236067 RepID=A0A841DQ03_9ACTN|nr:hypothetical protein [Kribbella solani]